MFHAAMPPRKFSQDEFCDHADSNVACGDSCCFQSYPSMVRAAAYPVIPGSILMDQRLASVES